MDAAWKESRQSEPAPQAQGGGEGQTPGEKPAQPSAAEPSQGGAQQQPSGTSYEGLDAAARQTLSQAHLLPDAEQWQKMPQKYRDNLVNSARELVASRTREFQSQAAQMAPRNEQGQFAPRQQPATGQGTEQNRAQAATTQQATGTPSADGTQANGQGGQQQQTPRGLEKIRKFADDLGQDLAAPLLEGLQEVEAANRESLTAMEQRLTQVSQSSQYALQRLVAQEEATAKAALTKEIPTAGTPEKWAQVVKNARVFAKAAYDAGEQFTWEQSLLTAGRALFSQDLQQQAQRQLAERRSTSLQGTPERGTQQVKPERAMNKDDWDRAALEALDSGKSVEEVRSLRH